MANVFTSVNRPIGSSYYGQFTGIFDTPTQETDVIKTPVLARLINLNWSVGAGTVILKWKGTPTNPDIVIATLSGSDSWTLGKGSFTPPALTTGEVTVTTLGFVINSTYTLVLAGTTV